jgi:hypothetical protein
VAIPFREGKSVIIFSLALCGAAALLFLGFGKGSHAAGVVLGGAAGIVNFYLLFKGLAGAYEKAKAGAGAEKRWAVSGGFLGRYLLLAAAFYAAFKTPGINFLAFVLGFFFVNLNLGVASILRVARSGG